MVSRGYRMKTPGNGPDRSFREAYPQASEKIWHRGIYQYPDGTTVLSSGATAEVVAEVLPLSLIHHIRLVYQIFESFHIMSLSRFDNLKRVHPQSHIIFNNNIPFWYFEWA